MVAEVKTELTQNEKATNAETWAHINRVMSLLGSVMVELQKRQFTHDRSKLAQPEVGIFSQFIDRRRETTYGGEDYTANLDAMRPALDHHYAHNRHHPEHFTQSRYHESHVKWLGSTMNLLDEVVRAPEGFSELSLTSRITAAKVELKMVKAQLEAPVNGMNLIDLLEMVVDWKASTELHADGDIRRSLEVAKKRFNLSPQLAQVIKNTIDVLPDHFGELGDTQKGL